MARINIELVLRPVPPPVVMTVPIGVGSEEIAERPAPETVGRSVTDVVPVPPASRVTLRRSPGVLYGPSILITITSRS